MASLLFVAAQNSESSDWPSSWVQRGYDVLLANSIDTAIDHIKVGGVDIVILDTDDSLGSMSRLVSKLDHLVDAPPLLLVSDSPFAPAMSAQIGAAGFLAKPCTAEDILIEVLKLVGPLRHSFFEDNEPTGQHSIVALAEDC